jgi:hypothetical protein
VQIPLEERLLFRYGRDVTTGEAQPSHDEELRLEQAYIDHAYACLGQMRGRAEHLRDLGYLGGNVTEGGVETHDRQQWERDKQRRVDLLKTPGGALCFGRIDRIDQVDQVDLADRTRSGNWYIGRRHVEDDRGRDPLPAASAGARGVAPPGEGARCNL